MTALTERGAAVRDAFAVVAQLGERLAQEKNGWRDTKALIVLVAQAGEWGAAAQLADALGVGPDVQEAIYREVSAEAATQ